MSDNSEPTVLFTNHVVELGYRHRLLSGSFFGTF